MKRSLERVLVAGGAVRLRRLVGPPRFIVLAYHNVVPSGSRPEGDTSLHLGMDRFQAQLDALQGSFRVVSLPKLLQREDPGDGIQVAITFDDAYRGALVLGMPELVKRGLPATVFVAPGLLEEEGFWWDLLADPASGSVPVHVRHHALWKLGGRQGRVLRWATSTSQTKSCLPELLRPSSPDEVRATMSLPGITLGSHSWSHVNLAAVPEDEALDEAERSFHWLRDTGAADCISLSYPYGLRSDRAVRAVEGAGFHFAFDGDGGFLEVERVKRNRYKLPRLNVPSGMSLDGFLARVSGVWPT